MTKKTIAVILLAACLCSLSGCSGELRKKFVRKKKYEKKQIPVFKPKSYEAEFTREQRYINHSYVSARKHTLTKQWKHIYNVVRENFSYVRMKGYLKE